MEQLHSQPLGLIKLSGTLNNYRKQRGAANFLLNEDDKNFLGMVAIGAATVGATAAAMGVANNIDDAEEEADFVEFSINDKPCSGWILYSPFNQGDYVEVVGEWQEDHYEVYAIARPNDRIIALYPHCTRGKKAHYLNAAKWGGAFILVLNLFIILMDVEFFFDTSNVAYLIMLLGVDVFIAFRVYRMSLRWLPFTTIAEKIFNALELPYSGSVDLVKRTGRISNPLVMLIKVFVFTTLTFLLMFPALLLKWILPTFYDKWIGRYNDWNERKSKGLDPKLGIVYFRY